jgi:hypothetical protein
MKLIKIIVTAAALATFLVPAVPSFDAQAGSTWGKVKSRSGGAKTYRPPSSPSGGANKNKKKNP